MGLSVCARYSSRLLPYVTIVAIGLPIGNCGISPLVNAQGLPLPKSCTPPRSWNPWTRVNWEVEERANSTFEERANSKFEDAPVSRERRSDVDESIRATIRTVPQRIDQVTKDALNLAVKGATYSANAKLHDVLGLFADHLDAEQGTTRHSTALMAGLTALRESEDFTRASSMSMTMTSRAIGHATPVLHERESGQVTRIEALERYYSYASRQLGEAVQGMPEGSTALCHLGRLQPYLADGDDRSTSLVAARMVALHSAAMIADPLNYRAANELGVVLAQHGQLDAAREKLLYSAELGKRPETVRNLAIVLHKLGDDSGSRLMVGLADQQRRKFPPGRQAGRDAETPTLVSWVDHQQFSARAAAAENPAPVVTSPTDQTDSKTPNSDRSASKPKSKWKWKIASGRDSHDAPSAGDSGLQNSSSPATTGSLAKAKSARGAGIKTVGHAEGDESDRYGSVMDAPPAGIGHAGDAMLLEASGFEDGAMPQGEYLGLLRNPHVIEYFLHVDDALSFVFRLNGKPSFEAYRLNVADVIRITSLTAETLSLETLVQPDGTIVLPQIGSVSAAGKTIDALRRELDERYKDYIRAPSITVTPVAINRTVEELRSAIINRTGAAAGLPFNSFGQLFNSKVTPHGMISLPAIGNVPAQGLTLDELRREVESRYAEIANGIEVTPVLQQRAPNYIYVLGEVAKPGRYDLVAPTSVIQSISLAGGWNKGGNLNEVIIIRRDDSWHLMATRVKVRPALYNYPELASEDIWLRDSDIVIVPKLTVQVLDDWIELIFTKGLYGVIPVTGSISFAFFKYLTTLGSSTLGIVR